MQTLTKAKIATAAIVLAAASASALAAPQAARATLKNTDGETVGRAVLITTPNGVLLQAELSGLPKGTHAFHVHETGVCEPPFKSAGGHYKTSEDSKHGYFDPDGPHAGDMPNIHVGESGTVKVDVMTGLESLGPSLLDANGAALIIHAGEDDYKTDPAGDADARIACGVILPV